MSRKAPIIVGTTLGVIHFLVVGVPFIQSKGGGEAIGYLTLFVDFPLAVAGELAFPRLLLSSVRFNFFWFVVLGTIMYFSIGYGAGVLVSRARRKKKAEI